MKRCSRQASAGFTPRRLDGYGPGRGTAGTTDDQTIDLARWKKAGTGRSGRCRAVSVGYHQRRHGRARCRQTPSARRSPQLRRPAARTLHHQTSRPTVSHFPDLLLASLVARGRLVWNSMADARDNALDSRLVAPYPSADCFQFARFASPLSQLYGCIPDALPAELGGWDHARNPQHDGWPGGTGPFIFENAAVPVVPAHGFRRTR